MCTTVVKRAGLIGRVHGDGALFEGDIGEECSGGIAAAWGDGRVPVVIGHCCSDLDYCMIRNETVDPYATARAVNDSCRKVWRVDNQ